MAEWRPLAGPLAARVSGVGHRVVFLHGFTQTSQSWDEIAAHVAHAGHEVALVDLPGHGGSAAIRADLRRTADLLAATTGQATYVGYSLGGRVAMHLALMYPHIVDRLVLIGADPGITDPDLRTARLNADAERAERLLEQGVAAFLTEWSAQPLFAGLVLSADDRAARESNTPEGLATSLRLCGTGNQVPLWDRLLELNMPVLAMAGALDTKFVPIAERIAGSVPDGTFAVVHAAGHAAHLQQPMQVVTRLDAWMRGTRIAVVS